jgi:hypothetical protein
LLTPIAHEPWSARRGAWERTALAIQVPRRLRLHARLSGRGSTGRDKPASTC